MTTQRVKMVMFVSVMVVPPIKGVLKYVIMEYGEVFVVTHGLVWKLVLSVDG